MNKHRKAVSVAINAMLFDELSDEERDALEAQNAQTWHGIQLNATDMVAGRRPDSA